MPSESGADFSLQVAAVLYFNAMTIFKTQHSANFTVLPNSLLRDKRLSFKSRGLLAMILSNCGEWVVTAKWLEQNGLEGRESIRAGLNELKVLGYATFERRGNSKAGRTDCVWCFYDTEGHFIEQNPVRAVPVARPPVALKKRIGKEELSVSLKVQASMSKESLVVARGNCDAVELEEKGNAVDSERVPEPDRETFSETPPRLQRLPKPPRSEFTAYIDNRAERFPILSSDPDSIYREWEGNAWCIKQNGEWKPILNWKALLPRTEAARAERFRPKLRSRVPEQQTEKEPFFAI